VFARAIERSTDPVEFSIDGRPVAARAGESLLVAMLTNTDHLRRHEFGGAPRAGFCLMGACQDCWVWLEDGDRVRACTTLVAARMRVRTTPPAIEGADNA